MKVGWVGGTTTHPGVLTSGQAWPEGCGPGGRRFAIGTGGVLGYPGPFLVRSKSLLSTWKSS